MGPRALGEGVARPELLHSLQLRLARVHREGLLLARGEGAAWGSEGGISMESLDSQRRAHSICQLGAMLRSSRFGLLPKQKGLRKLPISIPGTILLFTASGSRGRFPVADNAAQVLLAAIVRAYSWETVGDVPAWTTKTATLHPAAPARIRLKRR